MEYIGFILQFIVVMFANAGGIAGGSMMIPLIIMFNKFSSKQVAQMTPIYNGLAGLCRYVINIWTVNPIKPEKTIIDYDIACLILPLNIFATVIGGIINSLFPDIIISFSLFCFLVFVAYKMLTKGIKTWKKESKKKQDAKEAAAAKEEAGPENSMDLSTAMLEESHEPTPMPGNAGGYSLNKPDQDGNDSDGNTESDNRGSNYTEFDETTRAANEKALKRIMWQEKSNFFHVKFVIIMIALITMVTFVVITGVIKVDVLERCHVAYWVLMAITIIIMVGLSIFGLVYLKMQYAQKQRIGYKFTSTDVQLTTK